jgi:hypothetical protein
VQGPSFASIPQQATTQGADLMGAQGANYNAQLSNYNAQNAQNSNMMNGLLSLAGPAAMYFSDRRLKTNIKHIGKTQGGVNVYSYDYVWGEPNVGVMADEVSHMPGAVHTHSSGFKMVDYSKVK